MKTLTAIICALVAANAHSINVRDVSVKCTMPDGKTSYQTGSCPAGSKIEVVGSSSSAPTGDSWSFDRATDPMTGTTNCTARSPRFTIPSKRDYPAAQIVVIAAKEEPIVTVVNLSAGTIFHHNIRGTGMKIGGADMLPFADRPNQTTLVMPKGTGQPLVDSMLNYSTARVRVRYWPWDEPYDSLAIPLQGFKQAYSLAKSCSEK